MQLIKSLASLLFFSALFSSSQVSAFTVQDLRNDITHKGVPIWKHQADTMRKFVEKNNGSEVQKIWEELSQLTEKNMDEEFERFIVNPPTEQAMVVYANWLRWKILTKNADGRYAYYYAYLIQRGYEKSGNESMKNEPMIFYVLAHLSSEIDSLYCADKSARGQITRQYEQKDFMTGVNNIKLTKSKSEMLQYFVNALSIEEMRGPRPPQAVFCRQGYESISKAVKLGRMPTAKVIAEGPMKGITVSDDSTVDTSDIQPEYISNEAFLDQREKFIISSIKAFSD